MVVLDLTKLPDNEVKKTHPQDEQGRYLPGKTKMIYSEFHGIFSCQKEVPK